MNQIALREEPSMDTLVLEVESMQKMCVALMKSKHYAAMGDAGIFAIIQKARSLNINPLEALNGGLYYVNGKVGMSSEMMASLIRQQGHSIVKDGKSNASICILHGKRADNGDTWACEFSMEDAKRAGIDKHMYQKYPAIMLYNRCMSMLARQLFPDVIKGAGYTREELMEIKPTSPPSSDYRDKPEVDQELEVIEYITEDQAIELNSIIDNCDPEYKAKLKVFFKGLNIQSETLRDLPSSRYEKVLIAASRKRDEYQAKKIEHPEPILKVVGQ